MYNLNSHYENIYHFLSTIVAQPRVLYLHPFGSSQPENIEVLAKDMSHLPNNGDPLFIFYDQEPIYGAYNFRLFDYIRDNMSGPFVLVTTEKESSAVEDIRTRYGWEVVYYFHHVFAAHDWFRGYSYDSRLTLPVDRTIKKKYVTFNRLTSNSRVYRSLLISELIERNILSKGHVSYNDTCPDGGSYADNLSSAASNWLISWDVANKAIANISTAPLPLRVDYKDRDSIPNHSFVLSAVPETQESFVYVVTETCFWDRKHHLTEKIFKPIVSQMPFLLVGPAHNLKYLREYGFETFGQWWDESYDDIEDPVLRLKAVADVLETICKKTDKQLERMLKEMQDVLSYNYNRFYSQDFLDAAWCELTDNLRFAIPL
jgi:hypothetical protein